MFRDREDAGEQLAEQLAKLELRDPLILGIPRGGVVTAAAIARRLDAELDVIFAHKLRSPLQSEVAFGAIGEDGKVYLNHHVEQVAGVSERYREEERRRQSAEIERRASLFRAVRPAAPMVGRSVIEGVDHAIWTK